MSNFHPIDRDTAFLFPASVDEWQPQRHLARFVVEVVEGLDLSEMVRASASSCCVDSARGRDVRWKLRDE